jgi:ribose-phosphate pyrophosphokinase
MEKFDEAYEKGLFDKVLTTNLVYQSPELLKRDYYVNVDMSKYIALLIDTLNHDSSISQLLNPIDKINARLEKYREEHK